MGVYLNPGNEKYEIATSAKIYVDKTGIISYCNDVLLTPQRYICVSRPRRFGKSLTADMLVAYYSKGCDSKKLFEQYEIGRDVTYEKNLNQYQVIFLNMQEFASQSNSIEEMLQLLKKSVLWELLEEYPDFRYFDNTNLTRTMQDIYQQVKMPFVVIIDEWDCVFREYMHDQEAQKRYLDFLRDLLKDKAYIALAYMTGILPIKKYGTHSALNMFDEFSMTFAGPLAEYVGFTDEEVKNLCESYDMDFEETKKWYDGYCLEEFGSVYNPRSVINAMQFHKFQYYWNQTETFEALRTYIDMNFEGLKDDIVAMMNEERKIPIDMRSFSNDMVTLRSKDDVFTLLVHLGYLGYLSDTEEVFIPNQEIRNEFVTAVSNSDWGEVSSALRNYYTVYRELPTGKGFADLVWIPRKNMSDKPALVIELKWDKNAQGAIEQIKNKQYVKSLEEYQGNMLLVGINYDVKTKTHECIIEDWKK